MTAVAGVLLRDWDGRRLLRFLTGLALLALAFTSPVADVRAEAPAPVVASATRAEPVAAVEFVTQEPVAAPSRPVVSTVVVTAVVALLVGLTVPARSVRGPPLR